MYVLYKSSVADLLIGGDSRLGATQKQILYSKIAHSTFIFKNRNQ